MLTYRVGSSGGLSGARAMAAHLLEATMPPELARAAAYYALTPGLIGADPGPETFAATVPRVREDLDPRLAALLGLDSRSIPGADAIAQLLAGRRADGEAVQGRAQQRPTLSLAAETGLAPDRLPTAEEVARVLAGRHAGTGEPLPEERAAGLRGLLLRLLGADDAPAEEVASAVAQGRRADGGPLRPAAYLDGITASRAPIGFVDLCFSADKSLSAAWALAGTDAERGLLHAAHRDAVAATMRTVEATLGRVRRGKAGRGGCEPGRMAWICFDHATSRPTIEVAVRDPETGEGYAHLATVRVAGTPQIHTHVCCLARHVLTASGHVGSADLSQLRGRVHGWGALYQAHVATGLRRLGIATRLDPQTGAARVVAVPERVRTAFSRRTAQGEAAARAYARSKGLDWDGLDAGRRIGLLKQGVQGDPRAAKRDDCADLETWRREAEAFGWSPGPLSNLDAPIPLPDRAERVRIARTAAASLLATSPNGGAAAGESAARIAAARGLVASGIESAAEIDEVTRALLADGIEIRQRAAQERALADLARAGRAGEVLDVLRDQDRARLAAGTQAEATEAVAALWQERAAALGEDAVLVVAPTGEDCRTVSLAIRRRKRAMGRLGPDVVVLDAADPAGDVYELPLAVGDRVQLHGRTHARGAGAGLLGVNGSIVEVRAIGGGGLVLRSAKGREGLVPWNALRDRETGRIRLGPGDCRTLVAAQGATAEECIAAMPGGSAAVDAGAFCVAMTRHRSTSWLVLGEGAERRAVAACRSIGDARPIRSADLWSHAAEVFSRRRGSESALDLLDRAAGARRAVEDTFRRGLARLEARAAHGMAATILPGRRHRCGRVLALGSLAAGLAARTHALVEIAAARSALVGGVADAADAIRDVAEMQPRAPG